MIIHPKCVYFIILSNLLLFIPTRVWAGDFDIRPGKGIGKVSLGMSRQTIYKLLGQPTRIIEDWNQEQWETPQPDKHGLGVNLSVTYSADKVVEISVNSPRFVTEKGISTRSHFSQIRKVFKNLKLIGSYQVMESWSYIYEDK